jgi:ketosteroid isomerase-like protein
VGFVEASLRKTRRALPSSRAGQRELLLPRRKSMKRFWSILAVLVVAGLVAGPAAAADDTAVLKARALAWQKAYNDGKPEAIAAMYAQDGTRMPPSAVAAEGREAILTQLRESQKAAPGVVIETSNAVADGSLGITNGTNKIKAKDGAVIDEGKWVSVGKKIDGEWTTVRDIWIFRTARSRPSSRSRGFV